MSHLFEQVHFQSKGYLGVVLFFVFVFLIASMFYRIPVFNADSVDLDQTPHSAASDLGLHCLQMIISYKARHKLVNSLPYSL